ncbi:hypothetical protein B0H16DRAFT_902073 [Mycena metata]|uniref:Uncharacterized protein n=1 Tax=Mycena metata TaxID=1033252 RepID=A0AAD7ISV3_9AGAR|nr:hypothetical protein B0H16DRAFT_902073 [Mycena metata]
MRKLDSLLAHSLPDVQRYGLRVLVLLAQQENLRALTPIRKAVQQVISMLTDGDADRRQYAIQYLDELLVYEDLRKLIATSGIMMRQSGAMLRSGDFDVRRSGLWITVAILQPGMWEGISMTDAMERVISAGEDPHVGVRRLAIWGVLDLAKRDGKHS